MVQTAIIYHQLFLNKLLFCKVDINELIYTMKLIKYNIIYMCG